MVLGSSSHRSARYVAWPAGSLDLVTVSPKTHHSQYGRMIIHPKSSMSAGFSQLVDRMMALRTFGVCPCFPEVYQEVFKVLEAECFLEQFFAIEGLAETPGSIEPSKGPQASIFLFLRPRLKLSIHWKGFSSQ